MSKNEIKLILNSAFKKTGVNPFIYDIGDSQDAVIVEIDLLDDDDPIRFAIYVDEVKTKDDILQNLAGAMNDFETYENGESYPEEAGYYPGSFSDQANSRQPVTAEYMPISKESSEFLYKLGNKLIK